MGTTARPRISYDGRTFRAVSNSATGQVGGETSFHYHQQGDVVWAEYAGGQIARGMLIRGGRRRGAPGHALPTRYYQG